MGKHCRVASRILDRTTARYNQAISGYADTVTIRLTRLNGVAENQLIAGAVERIKAGLYQGSTNTQA